MRTLPRPQQRVTTDASLAIINVVLLLIFFFLVTGQIVAESAGGVEIAVTTELPYDQLPKPLLVINSDGSWSVDDAPVAPEFLDLAIAALPGPVILHILIDRDAPANALLEVVNRPELATAEIRLVTLREMPDAGVAP